MKWLLVIGGATASGKTALSVQLARHFHAEILSADSRQFYRDMCIGTAKPTAEELAAARHHFVDTLDVTDAYSVGDFERDALSLLEHIYQSSDIAIVAGGSGLFLRALCEGLDVFPPISDETRRFVAVGEQSGGLLWLQSELAARDAQYFAAVDRNNPARLRRALEVCLETGLPYSSFRGHEKTPRPFTPLYILLEVPRAELYRRIDTRVDAMIAAGLEEEVRALLPYRHYPALQTVGYQEFFDFFDGKMSRGEAIDKIKQHSRNYAKRQATWFRKHGEWTVFQPAAIQEIIQFVTSVIQTSSGTQGSTSMP